MAPNDMHPSAHPEGFHLAHKPTGAISKNIPLSEVNRHCIPEDCWVALNGKVYDLSEFMDRHPGGPTTIVAWAGKDASKFFNEIHKGVKIDSYLRPESHLGNLGVDGDLMSDEFWHTLREARIVEVREEIDRVLSETAAKDGHKADSLPRLLQDKNLDPQLKLKLQRLETQKRAALDSEDYAKALDVKKEIEKILSDQAHAHMHDIPLDIPNSSGGIPLSEVARHNKPHDCWIAINKNVYDLTDFLIHHPEQRNSILAWAGRDATPMWDKIPGRFPSKQWMDFFMRSEWKMGDVGTEPKRDPVYDQLKQLHDELRRLQGPSKEDIEAAKTAVKVPGKTDAPTLSEESRFPKLAEISAGKELPFFTRAEVAKHTTADEPYMIIHNRVYNLKPLMGSHPGGDDILLSKAGTDTTKDFEVFEHSEKARVQRDRDMLVGQLVPGENTDWSAEATVAQVVGEETSEVGRYMKYKATDIAVGALAWYLYKTLQNTKPLSQFTYSRALRHLHLIMAVGIFGAVGTAQAASYSEGQTRKQMLWWHKQTGLAMLFALVVRFFLRMQSGIPPRFPGNPMVQMLETQSLRAFYVLALLLPVSGIANEYFLKWAPGSDKTGNAEDDKRNDRLAKQSIDAHKLLGKFLQFAWLPFHLGYTTFYHWTQGRGVVKKVSPFI
ncbi:Cytochrome b5 (CYTB5) [Durusdinium trenchii]|uniref:Cytochrome b5 (CYTB5) n=2 Tax=Durusdinium trenchii TaxID=1381693 RepID=A0ABP0L3S9_9DINO